MRLPPLDPDLSPVTGWTRAHWEAVADHLLDSLVPFASPGFARIDLPGRTSRSGRVSDGLEGYARSFLLMAFRVAGTEEPPVGLLERYARGLASGTDPGSPEAWPPLRDYAQQIVEAASIAIALHETRAKLWDALPDGVQDRVVTWLGGMVGKRTWDNNWRLFQVVIEQFLATVGGPHDPDEIDAGLARIEDWYVGDGWYTDGGRQCFDYYNAWAMHLYPLLWARMAGRQDRLDVYRERLRRFLSGFVHFFGGDGAPIHQGRSLTYRFASLAPLWAGAVFDASPLAPGVTRRVASGVLRHFTERGVPDERGLLPLGWYGTFLPATQPYSGPASPYWAAKGFLGLMLPADHPVWTHRERPAPIDSADQVVPLPAPGFLLHATARDGIVRLLNHGSDRDAPPDDPHYAKLAYSSRTAPETSPDAWEESIDNHIGFLLPSGRVTRRLGIRRILLSGHRAASRYESEHGDIETHAIVAGPWEIRVHFARGSLPVREGGYALADAAPPAADTGRTWAVCRRDDGLTSAIIGLYGWRAADIARHTDSNAFGRHSAIPYLTADTAGVHISLVLLTGEPVVPERLRKAVDVTVEGWTVVVRLPRGETTITGFQ